MPSESGREMFTPWDSQPISWTTLSRTFAVHVLDTYLVTGFRALVVVVADECFI